MGAEANAGKSLTVDVDGAVYERLPIKTRLVVRDGDLLFVTEKIVGITQGRAYPISEIQPRKLATFLSKYVTKTSHGIGLGMPETMEMALRECGTPRILFAAAVAAVTKLIGRRGDFYRIAGPKARAIDGPTKNTIPPYDSHVVLGPARPDGVAADIAAALGRDIHVLVVDINDFGGNILGSTTNKATNELVLKVLKDNPLGQDHQSTPLGIIRGA